LLEGVPLGLPSFDRIDLTDDWRNIAIPLIKVNEGRVPSVNLQDVDEYQSDACQPNQPDHKNGNPDQ
jgi:hypothetical protein